MKPEAQTPRKTFSSLRCAQRRHAWPFTKPALRSSLGDEHFKQACWVAFNSPPFHEVDVMPFVKRWKADGHLSAVMKDDGALRAQQVLERKRAEHKISFLAQQ